MTGVKSQKAFQQNHSAAYLLATQSTAIPRIPFPPMPWVTMLAKEDPSGLILLIALYDATELLKSHQ